MQTRTAAVVAALLVTLVVHPAAAQDRPSTRLSLMAGITEFDLSGVNTAAMFAVRVDRPFHPRVLGEASLSYARLEQQFGRSELFIPEIQVQFQGAWRWLEPYLGIGLGLAIDEPESPLLDWDVDPAPSAAVGVRADVNESVGVRVDGRFHGIGWDFAGTVSALTGGVTIAL